MEILNFIMMIVLWWSGLEVTTGSQRAQIPLNAGRGEAGFPGAGRGESGGLSAVPSSSLLGKHRQKPRKLRGVLCSCFLHTYSGHWWASPLSHQGGLINAQQKLGNGVLTCGGESHPVEPWGATETVSKQFPFPDHHDCQTRLSRLDFALESLGSCNCGLTSGWPEGRASRGHGRSPSASFSPWLVSWKEETKGQPKDQEWLTPGDELDGGGGEAVDRPQAQGSLEEEAQGQLCFLQSRQAQLQEQIPNRKAWNDFSCGASWGEWGYEGERGRKNRSTRWKHPSSVSLITNG